MHNYNMNTQMFLIITSPDPHGTPLALMGSQKSDTRGPRIDDRDRATNLINRRTK